MPGAGLEPARPESLGLSRRVSLPLPLPPRNSCSICGRPPGSPWCSLASLLPGLGLCPITRPTRPKRARRTRPPSHRTFRMLVFAALASLSPMTLGTRQRTCGGGGGRSGGLLLPRRRKTLSAHRGLRCIPSFAPSSRSRSRSRRPGFARRRPRCRSLPSSRAIATGLSDRPASAGRRPSRSRRRHRMAGLRRRRIGRFSKGLKSGGADEHVGQVS